jgi:hypothetical protein
MVCSQSYLVTVMLARALPCVAIDSTFNISVL